MSIRLYLKDGTNSLVPGAASILPWPDNDAFIQGKDSNGIAITVIPAINVIAAQIE